MTNNNSNIEDIIRSAISTVMGVEPESITESTNLVEDLGVSSIDIIDICFEIETSLNIHLDLANFFQTAKLRSEFETVEITFSEIGKYVADSLKS